MDSTTFFSCRWDETADFFHLSTLDEEDLGEFIPPGSQDFLRVALPRRAQLSHLLQPEEDKEIAMLDLEELVSEISDDEIREAQEAVACASTELVAGPRVMVAFEQ